MNIIGPGSGGGGPVGDGGPVGICGGPVGVDLAAICQLFEKFDQSHNELKKSVEYIPLLQTQ